MSDTDPIQELKSATERHLTEHRSGLASIYRLRTWLIVVILLTLLMPVLENRDATGLNYSLAPGISGFDFVYVTMGLTNNMGELAARQWALNPFGLAAYGTAIAFAYFFFVGRKTSKKFELYGSGLMFLALATAPLTHVFACQLLLPNFHNNLWHVQGLEFGWWLATACSLGFWLSVWSNQIAAPAPTPTPEEPKPSA